MSIIARLGVILGINIAEFKQGLDEAMKKARATEIEFKESAKRQKKSAEDMAEAFTKIGFAAAAAGLAIGNAFRQAADITDVSEGFDITVESLLATQKALMLAAGKAEDVSTVFNKLAQAQDAAKEGNDTVRESFERLGVSAGKVENLKLDRLFVEVAGALSKIEDTSKRAAVAQDLLGKAVKGVNWAEFVRQYKEFSDPSLVAAIGENDKAWENIEMSMKNISLLMQKIVEPMAIFVNQTFEAAKNLEKLESFNMFDLGKFIFTPQVAHLGLQLGQKKEKSSDIFQALPPESMDTPLLYGDNSKYSKQSAKQIAAQKTAATEAKRRAEEAKKLAETIADKEKQVAAQLQKTLELGKQTIANLSAESKIQNELLDLEMTRHLMSEDAYEIKKKSIEQTKELGRLTANYLRFEAEARAEMESATGLDAKYSKKLYEEKMQVASTSYAMEFTNLQKLQEKQIDVMKNTSAIRRQYEKEDRDIAYLNQLNAIDLQYKAVYENLKLEDQAFLLSTDAFNLLQMKLSVIQQIAEIEEEYTVKEMAIRTEFSRKSEEERNKELSAHEEKLKNLEKLKNRELEYLDILQTKREENYVNEVARQQSWVMGWTQASKEYFEAMEKAANRGAAAFNAVMGNMNQALSNFVDTGKLKFEDLALGIIRDLIRIELQAQASKVFGMLWNSISSAFGSPSVSSTPANASIAFRAAGGPFNGPTIVGENGPELLVPGMPGTIIPNGSWQQAAASMGSSGFTNNGTYIANMSAIDTQSATQFLASNKNTIWAAYQSANRSVPISR
jgi:lambda family phage tail tape measure protein